MGVGDGDRVGVCMSRSLDLVAAVLGVMKAGAAYVPLDPSFPVARLTFMLEDAGAKAVVTQSRIDTNLKLSAKVPIVAMDDPAYRDASFEPTCRPTKTGNLAYVMYTSGSTGNPKGVEVLHSGLVNFLVSMAREPGLSSADRLLSVTTISFDISTLELFLPLVTGAEVRLALSEEIIDGRKLRSVLENEVVTVLQATPPTWRMLLDAGWTRGEGLKALCGGEALPTDLAERILATGAELWNMYGPTETTVWSATLRIVKDGGGIRIGRPIANTQLYVVDRQTELCPIGVPGELLIGGDGVARGYFNRPDLTAERFLKNPFSMALGRVYRTGDLVRRLPDGTIAFLGRMDHQVKVRGYRIELGEIEAVLIAQSGIAQAVVSVSVADTDNARLIGYIVPKTGTVPIIEDVRRAIAERLPEYMVPATFVVLEAFPLTPNGKLDRRALPAPDQCRPATTTYAQPSAGPESRIAEIWKELLRLPLAGVHDNFFDSGGHSLLLVRLASQLEAAFGRTVSVVDLLDNTTIAKQAQLFAATQPTNDAIRLARDRAAKQRSQIARLPTKAS